MVKAFKSILACLLALSLFLMCGCEDDELTGFRVVETLGQIEYGAVFRMDDSLADSVDYALQTLAANGTLQRLISQWVPGSVMSLDSQAPEGECEPVAEGRVLVFGVESGKRPLCYEQEETLVGLAPDLAYAIGGQLGCTIRLQVITSDEVAAQLASGNIDCAVCADINMYTEKYSVSASYLETDIVVAVAAGSEYYSLKSLEGQPVAVSQDPTVQALLTTNERLEKYTPRYFPVQDNTEALASVADGSRAAAITDRIALDFYLG